MGESSGSIWERIVAWFRGMLGTSTGQDTTTGSRAGAGGLGSLKDTATKAAGSARDAASQAADRAKSTVDDVTARAKGTVDDLSSRAQGATGGVSDRASGAMSGARDRAQGAVDSARGAAAGAVDSAQSRLSGAASSVTSRGYDTGADAGTTGATTGAAEASDATAEDMDADGQDNRATAAAGPATGMTAEDLDQGGPDTAERPRAEDSGSATGGFKENDVTSEENAPAETGEGVTSSPSPAEHPEADQAATDVGSSGRPFAHTDDDWWDTDRPGMGTGSSLGEQGAASETGTEGAGGGGLGPSASAADVGTSTTGASYGGVDASGSGTGAMTAGGDTGSASPGGSASPSIDGTGGADYTAGGSASTTAPGTDTSGAGTAAGANVGGNTTTSAGGADVTAGSAGASGSDAGGAQAYSASYGNNANAATLGTDAATAPGGTDTGAGTSTSDAFTSAGGYTSAAGAEADVVGGYGESGTGTADTTSTGVDSPATAPGVGYAGSSPATDREGVGSYAPSAATGGGTGASSNDANLVQEAPDDAQVRSADQADAALAGTSAGETDLAADANAGTTFDETPDTAEDYSTAQGIVVGGLIAEDQQETGGDYSDEILVDAETQQEELPAADYEDLPTDTADTTEGAVTTTLGDQTTPAPTQASMTGTTGRGMTPDTAQGSEDAYEAAYGASRDAGVGTDTGTGTSGAASQGATASEEVDVNAPTVGVRGVNWVPGDGGHDAPAGFPYKGNASSRIYHPRESSTYERTIAEYYFATPEDAEAAGYRLPKALQNNGEHTGDPGRSTAAGVATMTTGGDTGTGGGAVASTASVTTTQPGARPSGQQGGAPQTSGKPAAGRQERPAPKGAVRAQGATCPDDYPIKGNANSRIYHMPAESSYEQTIPEFCFATEADAKAAGFRARKH